MVAWAHPAAWPSWEEASSELHVQEMETGTEAGGTALVII